MKPQSRIAAPSSTVSANLRSGSLQYFGWRLFLRERDFTCFRGSKIHTRAMKFLGTLLIPLSSVALLASTAAARPTLPELKVIPLRVLQRSISPKFYKSLTISPVDAHIVVSGSLVGTHLSGLRVVKSELGGTWDDLALKRAGEVVIAGNYTIDSPNFGHAVLLHLLIYNIADGTMALSFAHLDVPGGDQANYFGCARLAVLKA